MRLQSNLLLILRLYYFKKLAERGRPELSSTKEDLFALCVPSAIRRAASLDMLSYAYLSFSTH